jgi:hypothetical protein
VKRNHLAAFIALCVVTTLIIFGCARMGVPVRAYLFADQMEPPGFGAYGYLLFASQPSESETPRYNRVCAAFHRDLIEAWGNSPHERSSQMATFWPLKFDQRTEESAKLSALTKASEGKTDQKALCELLIANYDYRRASGIISMIRKQGARGPVLAAWVKPFGKANSSDALVLDLSDFADEDLDRAFAIWRERITTDPAVWRDGFNLVLCREAFRNFLQKYGDTVLAVIKPSKSG